jgi:hypothetical protein
MNLRLQVGSVSESVDADPRVIQLGLKLLF